MPSRFKSFIVPLIAATAIAGFTSERDLESPLSDIYRMLATHNTPIATNIHVRGEMRGGGIGCSTYICRTLETHPTLGFIPVISADSSAYALESATITEEREIGGVKVHRFDFEDGPTEYGAWLDSAYFQVATALVEEHTVLVGVMYGRMHEEPLPVEGTATYAGAMVGKDAISAANYAGAARLEGDFADTLLDATFSDIADIDTGESIADIEFPDVRVFRYSRAAFAQGLPSAPGTDTYFNTRFLGPDNEEIAGVFGKDTMIGAFGARRQ